MCMLMFLLSVWRGRFDSEERIARRHQKEEVEGEPSYPSTSNTSSSYPSFSGRVLKGASGGWRVRLGFGSTERLKGLGGILLRPFFFVFWEILFYIYCVDFFILLFFFVFFLQSSKRGGLKISKI